jgi:hypothetical protein
MTPEPKADAQVETAAEEKNGARRGFFSRVFGRGMDY